MAIIDFLSIVGTTIDEESIAGIDCIVITGIDCRVVESIFGIGHTIVEVTNHRSLDADPMRNVVSC